MSEVISGEASLKYHQNNPKVFERIVERFLFLMQTTEEKVTMNRIALDLSNALLDWNMERGGPCVVHQTHRRFYARLLAQTYPQYASRLRIEGFKSTNASDRKWMASLREKMHEVAKSKLAKVPDPQKREALMMQLKQDVEDFLMHMKGFLHRATLADRNMVAGESIAWMQVVDACRSLSIDPPLSPQHPLNMKAAKIRFSELAHLYHPDKNSGLPQEEKDKRARLLQEAQEAYDMLREWDVSFPKE